MKRTRTSDEQIAFALRQAKSGTPVEEICRKLGISEPTFYRWKKQYAGMGVPEIRRLEQLEDENGKLKKLVADLTLDRAMLRGTCSTERGEARRLGHEVAGHLRVAFGSSRAAGLPHHGLWPLLAAVPVSARSSD